MSVKTRLEEAHVHHTGEVTVLASKFRVLDDTDHSKVAKFDCSAISSGAESVITIPDVDSTAVLLSGTQTITGVKTFTGATVLYDTATIVDAAAPTKVARFEAGSITTGQTRVYTLPDYTDTLATQGGTETLTAKTLTAPTINAATLTGAIAGGELTPTVAIIPGANPPAQTAEGSAVWDTANDLLTVGTGASRKVMMDLDSNQTASGKTFTSPVLNTPTINRTGQAYFQSAAGLGKAGATPGWVVAFADNLALATVPAGITGGTLVIPITGLKVGWTITGYYLVGQIESGGLTATLQGALRVHTAAAGDVSDAEIEAGVLLSVTEDTAVTLSNTTTTLGTPNQVTGSKSYYMLISATTAVATDVALQGVYIIVTET